MPGEAHYLDVILLGKEYRVACPPEERDALMAAVAHVDAKMHEIAEKTKSNIAERIAVMAALNIAHEFLTQRTMGNPGAAASTLDFTDAKRRIGDMEAQLDAVLAAQDKLL